MNLNSSTHNIFIGLLTTLWIFLFFNIKFIAIGTLSIAIGLIVSVGLIHSLVHKKIHIKILLLQAPLFLAIAISLISFVYNKNGSDHYLLFSLFALSTLGLFSFSFFDFCKLKFGIKGILLSVILAFTMNALLVIAMFISPFLQSTYLSTLNTNAYEMMGGQENALGSMYRLRMLGFSGFSSYSSGFCQVMGLFFLSMYFYFFQKKLNLTFVIISAILIVSVILSSRSSLVGVILWLGFCLIHFKKHAIPVLLQIILAVYFMLWVLIYSLESKASVFFSSWIVDFFRNGFNSGSLSENIDMFNIPFLDSGFLGYSRWHGDLGYDYFRGVDIGFIRIILSGGFGSLVFIIAHFLLLGILFKVDKISNLFTHMYLFSLVFFFVIMFKGAIIFDFFAFDLLMLLIFWMGMQYKHREDSI
jgi:hypothetical protein